MGIILIYINGVLLNFNEFFASGKEDSIYPRYPQIMKISNFDKKQKGFTLLVLLRTSNNLMSFSKIDFFAVFPPYLLQCKADSERLLGSNDPATNQNTPATQAKNIWFGYNFRGGAPDPFLLNGCKT